MKEIKNLKPWDSVKTKTHDISGLKGSNPENYLYQLSNGVYYPSIAIRDLPKPLKKKIKLNSHIKFIILIFVPTK